MKVSILNLNLVGPDAIGTCIIRMARFFQNRGDQVRIYIEHRPEGVPAEIKVLCSVVKLGDLISGREGHFTDSGLFIYHYPIRYGLLETIKGIKRGAVIFTYYGVTPPDLWGSEEGRDLLVRAVEGAALVHYADLAITHSPFTQRELVERYGYDADRIRLFPLAVSLNQFCPGQKDSALVIKYALQGQWVLLFVGRMAGNKRIDLLVQALAQVKIEIANTKLLLVGDNHSAPAYVAVAKRAKELAAKLGIAEDVIFTGRVDDLPEYYRLADVFVTASLHEGFGMPIIEAMACGVPVVASHSTALPWVIGEAGFTFAPGDAGELAEKVLLLLKDEERRRESIRRGLDRAQDFTLERYEAGLAQVIEEATRLAHGLPVPRLPEATGLEGPAVRAPAPAIMEAQPTPLAEESRLTQMLSILESEADVALRDYVIRSNKPIIAPLIVHLRQRMTSHLREPYLDRIVERQVTFNQHLLSALRSMAQELARGQSTSQELAQHQQELVQHHQELAHHQEETVDRMGRAEAEIGRLETKIACLGERVEVLLRLLSDLLTQTVGKHLPAERQGPSGALEAMADQTGYGFSYYACHRRVGGRPEDERALYEPFARLFEGQQKVLDLGCGRGVFLSLLREERIPSYGIDRDEDMVAACKTAGLEAIHAEVLEHLGHLEEDSLGGIFCAHLIEHLPKAQLMPFLNLCYTRLQPEAPIVLITPNGAGLTIFHHTFYKDPTHNQPLHPEAVRFLLESTGFRQIEVQFLSPMPQESKLHLLSLEGLDPGQAALAKILNEDLEKLNELLYGPLDCAFVAYK